MYTNIYARGNRCTSDLFCQEKALHFQLPEKGSPRSWVIRLKRKLSITLRKEALFVAGSVSSRQWRGAFKRPTAISQLHRNQQPWSTTSAQFASLFCGYYWCHRCFLSLTHACRERGKPSTRRMPMSNIGISQSR